MDVITYWNAIALKAGDTRSWEQLEPQQQHMVIQSINLLIQVLNSK